MATITVSHKTIPGPRALPLLRWRTNLLKLYREPFSYLRWLHDTYGDVVTLAQGDLSYICAFGPTYNFYLLSDPDLFVPSASVFQKLPRDTALGRLFFYNLSLMNGEHHKQQRRLMQPAFHRKQIALYHDDMVALTNQMLDDWQGKSEIDLHRQMQQLTQRIAVKTLFGIDDETELERVGRLLQRLIKEQMLLLIAPINMPGTPYHRALHLAEQLTEFIRAMIAQKRSQPGATDVLASLVHAHDEDGTKLTEDELIGHAFTLFVAGHETTSNALTWTIFLLHQHPRIFASLLDEIEGILHGTVPIIEQLNALPLLDGVIKESLRLLPPALLSLRMTTTPCQLGDFALPAGTNIIYSPFLTHRLPELYEEPDSFKPERWNTLNRTAYEYLPFAAGQHRCIGAEFAVQEMKVVLSLLLQRYRLAIVPNTKIDLQTTMRPRHGLPVRIFPQDRQFQCVPLRGNINQLIAWPQ